MGREVIRVTNNEARSYASSAINQLELFLQYVRKQDEFHGYSYDEFEPPKNNDFAWFIVKTMYEDELG